MRSICLRRHARLLMLAAAIPALGALTSGCTAIVEERGYVIDQNDLAKLQAGQTGKEDARSIMGSPSTISTIDGEAWYYISSRFKTFAFYKPEETNRTVVALYFDRTDTVQQVAYYGLEDGQIVNFKDRKTPTRGKELTILGQIFGNLGKFNNTNSDARSTGRGTGAGGGRTTTGGGY
jgi:outer membrane protein assembly factor BamE (lipoprotein component of BamABCDE complex)